MEYCFHYINLPQGLIPFFKNDYIPVVDIPSNPKDKAIKERRMQFPDEQLGQKIIQTMGSIDSLFLEEQKKGATYLTLYEMFEITLLGITPLNGYKKENLNAIGYDHGNRSSASLLLSSMNKYTAIDFSAIENAIKKIRDAKNPTDRSSLIKGLIKNVGNMEFILSIIAIAEQTNAIFDKEMAKYSENTAFGKEKLQQLRDRQDGLNKHITELMNNYLKQARLGNQSMYPNISPAADNSFIALATKLAYVNNGFDQLSKDYEIYDFNYAMSLLEPLEKCKSFSDSRENNPFMVNKPYDVQIQQAQAIYYNKSLKAPGRNSTENNQFKSFMEDGMC